MEFNNEFVRKTINFNFNFDRMRKSKNFEGLQIFTLLNYKLDKNVLIECTTFKKNIIFFKIIFIHYIFWP